MAGRAASQPVPPIRSRCSIDFTDPFLDTTGATSFSDENVKLPLLITVLTTHK